MITGLRGLRRVTLLKELKMLSGEEFKKNVVETSPAAEREQMVRRS